MSKKTGLPLAVLSVIGCLLVTPYVWNAVKLSNCDFESDFKCEVIHGVGLVAPPASYVTVWFDDDKGDSK